MEMRGSSLLTEHGVPWVLTQHTLQFVLTSLGLQEEHCVATKQSPGNPGTTLHTPYHRTYTYPVAFPLPTLWAGTVSAPAH